MWCCIKELFHICKCSVKELLHVWYSIKELEQKLNEAVSHCRSLEQDVAELQQTNQVLACFATCYSVTVKLTPLYCYQCGDTSVVF